MKKALYYCYFLFGWLLLLPSISRAAVESLTEVADDITTGPLEGMHHFLNGMSVIIGVIFIVMAVKKYIAYRDNLVEVPLMTALRYFILGLILLLLPLIFFLVQRAGT